MKENEIITSNNLPFSNEYINKCIEDCKSGFTLAEVLITLTVIGVVAALTVPSLIQSYKDKQYDTAAKKAESVLANGYKMMLANEDNVSFSQLPIFECEDDFKCLSDVHKKIFKITSEQTKSHNGLSEAYTKSDDSGEAGFTWDNVPYIFTTDDGMNMGYVQDDGAKTFSIVVDTNGEKGPNKVEKDILKFRVNSDGTLTKVSSELDNAIVCNLTNYEECSQDELDELYNSLPPANGPYAWETARCLQGDKKCIVLGSWEGHASIGYTSPEDGYGCSNYCN